MVVVVAAEDCLDNKVANNVNIMSRAKEVVLTFMFFFMYCPRIFRFNGIFTTLMRITLYHVPSLSILSKLSFDNIYRFLICG